MIPTSDFLTEKRTGGRHTPDEIRSFIKAYVSGEVADYQMSAWLMAVCINGLDPDETVALTEAMIASGETIDLSTLPSITVDKHSTGGVGDKTTLVLAPLLASAGLTMAKMSGRGLGITGGTLDKLESIPGFSTQLTKEQFLDQAASIGCVLAGHTGNLVPADKKIYALRDVTATVECIPLIASSVMSKKIACGASIILLDVKTGSGAFMKDIESARKLARTMIEIGNMMGRRTIAAITGMEQPLGLAVGNSIEVAESIETLRGGGPSDLRELCIELGAFLLEVTGISESHAAAKERLEELIASGAALEKFREVVSAQGSDTRVLGDPTLLPQAAHSRPIFAGSSGFIQSVNAYAVGRAAGMLGAGRQKKEDEIDPASGVILKKKSGDSVKAGEEVAVLLYNNAANVESAAEAVSSAYKIGPDAPVVNPLMLETLGF
ncbi:MAG: thymidine phosphorylase [Armatimonadota bacterium]